MALCIACSAETHEQEDCPYREPTRDLRRQGIAITAAQMREMDDAARAGS